ncbi:hypothetical protein [Burkholderia phage BCSR5]|nr:hypothetical protein [Burkholderia phage BCSR5]
MNKQFKQGDNIVEKDAPHRKGFVMADQSMLANGAVRVCFEGDEEATALFASAIKWRSCFTIIGSKTSPHDEDYSPAVVDSAETIEAAMALYKTVMDYPFSWIEYHDVHGDTWDFDPRKVERK